MTQINDEDINRGLAELAEQRIDAPDHLTRQILAKLGEQPEHPADRLLDWFTDALWRPVLAMFVPVALGFSLGFTGEPEGLYQPETLLYSETIEEVFSDEI